jgi:hypothetical protein
MRSPDVQAGESLNEKRKDAVDRVQKLWYHNFCTEMVGVAQLVRVPGCGPGGRGFEPHRSPQ